MFSRWSASYARVLPAQMVSQVVEFHTDRHRVVHSGPALRRLHSVATIDDYLGIRFWPKTLAKPHFPD